MTGPRARALDRRAPAVPLVLAAGLGFSAAAGALAALAALLVLDRVLTTRRARRPDRSDR